MHPAGSEQSPVRRPAAGLCLLAGAGLAFEIMMTRLLSITLWYHFAFMVISVAMLGFGAAGTLYSLCHGHRFFRRPAAPARLSAATALGMITALLCLAHLRPDLYQLGSSPGAVAALVLIYVVLILPFLFTGLTVAVLLDRRPENAGFLYGADLVGAALGCLAVIPGVQLLGLPGAVALAAAAAAAAGLLLIPATPFGSQPDRTSGTLRITMGILTVTCLAMVPVAGRLMTIKAGHDKMLSLYTRESRSPFQPLFRSLEQAVSPSVTGSLDPGTGDWPDMEHLTSVWDRFCRIDTAAFPDRHAVYGIGAPTTFRGDLPGQIMITQDGDAATFITRHTGDFSRLEFIDQFLYGLPYTVLDQPHVLVIGAGGGTDILAALKHGARAVGGIELNPATVRAVKTVYSEFSGRLYDHPRVTITVGEGRSVLQRIPDRFDLIQMTGVDTWAASSQGAYMLSENFLYTVEAFEDYYDHLQDGGILSIVRARFAIPRETLRLCSLAMAMLETRGIHNPGRRIMVVTEPGTAPNIFAGFMLKKGEWTRPEIQAVRRFCGRTGFRIAGGPGSVDRTPFNVLLHSDDPRAVFREYPYDITPVTDDRPYFFKLHRWRQIRMDQPLSRWLGIDLGARPGTGHESGLGILTVLSVQAVVFSGILVLLPLLSRNRIHRPMATGAYFFCIGAGFMFLEIALIQRFTLFLGDPARSLSVTLLALLGFTGLGSMVSGRVPTRRVRSRMGPAAAAVTLLAVTAAAGLPPLLGAGLHLHAGIRSVAVILLLAPVGLLLGFFFPWGIRRAGEFGDASVAWAWAVNGCASVTGSVAAVVLSMSAGGTALILCGAILYICAAVSGRWLYQGESPG